MRRGGEEGARREEKRREKMAGAMVGSRAPRRASWWRFMSDGREMGKLEGGECGRGSVVRTGALAVAREERREEV